MALTKGDCEREISTAYNKIAQYERELASAQSALVDAKKEGATWQIDEANALIRLCEKYIDQWQATKQMWVTELSKF
jgi:hypothetical protein